MARLAKALGPFVVKGSVGLAEAAQERKSKRGYIPGRGVCAGACAFEGRALREARRCGYTALVPRTVALLDVSVAFLSLLEFRRGFKFHSSGFAFSLLIFLTILTPGKKKDIFNLFAHT